MNYLYHGVPANMTGDTLYPLNTLKEKFPEVYAEHSRKYAGREEQLEFVIPSLNCLWNDVLHFSPVHPKFIKDAIIDAGGKKDLKMTCYEVDPHVLDLQKTTVYLYKKFVHDMMNENNFATYNPDEIEQYASMPQETKDYFKESYGNGKRPLPFHKIPHILYKGSINITGLPIVEV